MRARLAVILSVSLAGCSTPFEGIPAYRPRALEGDAATGGSPAEVPPGGSPEARREEAPPAPVPLSLEECIRIAIAGNRNLRIADRRVLIAEDKVTEAWSNLFPRVTGSGKYDARSNDQGGRLGSMEFVMGDRQVFTGQVTALVPLYTFGRVANQGRAETLRVGVEELDARRTREDLELAVSRAFFRILEAERLKGVVDESILVVERQLEVARDFYLQGMVAKSDVLAAEVQIAERRQERIRAENNIQLATSTLNRLMGMDVDRPTRVIDVLEAAPWSGNFRSVLTAAIERRPDLQALRKQIEIDQAEYRATRSGLLPYLYGQGSYHHSSDSFLLNDQWVSGGVVLEWPIFDGTTFVRLKRKGKEIAEAVDLRDDRADDIVLEVKQAYLGVREAAERIPVARKSIDQAEENLRMVRDQYGEGLVSITDVLTEEDRLSRSRSSYFRSLYDYHDAFARLKNAISGSPPGEPAPTGGPAEEVPPPGTPPGRERH